MDEPGPYLRIECACGHSVTLYGDALPHEAVDRLRCTACGRVGRPAVLVRGWSSGVNAMAMAHVSTGNAPVSRLWRVIVRFYTPHGGTDAAEITTRQIDAEDAKRYGERFVMRWRGREIISIEAVPE
jgi:hypothetical protein